MAKRNFELIFFLLLSLSRSHRLLLFTRGVFSLPAASLSLRFRLLGSTMSQPPPGASSERDEARARARGDFARHTSSKTHLLLLFLKRPRKKKTEPRPPSTTSQKNETKKRRLPDHRRRPLLPRWLRPQVRARSRPAPELRAPAGLRAGGAASGVLRRRRAAPVPDAAAPRVRRASPGADGASSAAAGQGERVPDVAAELRMLLPVIRDVLQLN